MLSGAGRVYVSCAPWYSYADTRRHMTVQALNVCVKRHIALEGEILVYIVLVLCCVVVWCCLVLCVLRRQGVEHRRLC